MTIRCRNSHGIKFCILLGIIASAVIAADAPAPKAENPQADAGLSSAEAKKLPQLTVAALPAHIGLAAGEEWSRVTYQFANLSPQDFQIVGRSAFFHSLETDWQSRVIGPIATDVKLPSLSQTDWKDTPQIPAEIVAQAQQAGALEGKELLFVQNFTLKSPAGEITHVSVTIVFRVDAEPPATEHMELPHYDVTVLNALRADKAKGAQLAKFLEFAEGSYGKLSTVLGFTPHSGRKVPLHVISYGGYSHYQAGRGGYVNMPCDVIESQGTSEWLFVAYPHELTHYFLLEEFPDPPRWFIEGPASFFGTKVAGQLGYQGMVKEDRKKIAGWAAEYASHRQQYVFTDVWPGDGGEPGEGYALGLGRGYELCAKLEELCGPDFFRHVFQYMHEARVSFTGAKTEKERIEILLGAMQAQSSEDLWAFFEKEGFKR